MAEASEQQSIDLESDKAILKLVAFIGACLTLPGGEVFQITRQATKLNEWLAEWLDDSA